MPDAVKEKETVSKKTIKSLQLVNPFATLKVSHQQYQELPRRKVVRVSGVEVDKDTHTVAPTFEKYDLWEEIQQCKDLAGLDYMKKLLMTGQAKPSDYYDDGKSGIDTTVFPETVHEAKAEAVKGNEYLAKLAAALGIEDGKEINQDTLEQILSSKIKEIWDKQQSAANSEGEGK